MSTFQEPSTSMPYVKVKTKGQVTIPAEFRRDLNLKEGDLLEVVAERGGILLKPKAVVDRYDEKWAENALREAQEEARQNPQTRQEEDEEERRLLDLGASQAKRLNIKPQDAEKLVHNYRKTTQKKIRVVLERVQHRQGYHQG